MGCYNTLPCEVCLQGSSSCILHGACVGIVSPCWLKSTHREEWGYSLCWSHNTCCRAQRTHYHSCRSSQTQPALQSAGQHSEPPSSVHTQVQHIHGSVRSIPFTNICISMSSWHQKHQSKLPACEKLLDNKVYSDSDCCYFVQSQHRRTTILFLPACMC